MGQERGLHVSWPRSGQPADLITRSRKAGGQQIIRITMKKDATTSTMSVFAQENAFGIIINDIMANYGSLIDQFVILQ